MAEQGEYLTVKQVQERLLAAGYHDSGQTIRRLLGAGEFGDEGVGWYRTERGGHRRVAASAVDKLIARRRKAAAPPSE